MNNGSRRIIGGVALLFAMSSGAWADTISQVFTFGPHPTDVNGSTPTTQTFAYFQQVAPIGAVLDTVSLSVSITESISGLSFTDVDGVDQFGGTIPAAIQHFTYYSTASFGFIGTAPAKSLLSAGLPGSSVVLYSVGDMSGDPNSFLPESQTINPGDNLVFLGSGNVIGSPDTSLVGNYSLNNGNGLGGTTDLTPYTFSTSLTPSISAYNTTGNFTLGYTTSTGEILFGGGGNVQFAQSTSTNATFTLVYTYENEGTNQGAAPEPATFGLIASALFILFRMRSKKKLVA
jgi:hypothetical protein